MTVTQLVLVSLSLLPSLLYLISPRYHPPICPLFPTSILSSQPVEANGRPPTESGSARGSFLLKGSFLKGLNLAVGLEIIYVVIWR